MIKKIKSLLLLTMGFMLSAQSTTTIFSDDFGQSTVRKKSSYTPEGFGYFKYADPNTIDDPSTSGGDAYKYNEQVMAYTVENNYYVVLAPSYLKTSMAVPSAGSRFWAWADNNNVLYLNRDRSNTLSGAAMYVNAGLTLASFYKREIPVDLVPGRYYKLSYYAALQNSTSKISSQLIDSNGTNILGSKTVTLSGTRTQWNKYETIFFIPTGCTPMTGNFISLVNANAVDSGNDFIIDDISFEDLGTTVQSNAITVKCSLTDSQLPKANDDVKLNQTRGSTITVNILDNDRTMGGQMPTSSNIDFRLFGFEGLTTYTVPGEGTWSYSNGVLKFVPLSTFNGDPTPVTYTFVDKSSGSSSTYYQSNVATVTITYSNALKAEEDILTKAICSDKVNSTDVSVLSSDIAILANDKLADNSQATNTNVTVKLYNDARAYVSGNVLNVPNVGQWTYNPSTGILTFLRASGYLGVAKMYYTINASNSSSALTEVSLTFSENTDCDPLPPVANVCIQPAIGGTPDGYTKFGISTQTTPTSGWPTNVPNGHIVLESKNKGFVITRTVESAITRPVEGMLIYDTLDRCIKLYSVDELGIGQWTCIQKSCNE